MKIARFVKPPLYGQFGEIISGDYIRLGNDNCVVVDTDDYESIELKSIIGKPLWGEDDALPHDRVRIDTAYLQITGTPYTKRVPLIVIDGGDCTWEILDKYVICRSYPGNNAIYERLL